MKLFTLSVLVVILPNLLGAQTWNQDIAPIIYDHCGKCHHEGGIAPDPFVTYTDAFDNSDDILDEILDGNMPPWPANHNYTNFIGENVLSDDEIALIQAWVDNDSPEGTGSAPPVPSYFDGFQIGTPDEIISIPSYDVTVDADVYRTFVIPSTSNEDRNIGAIEFDPDNDQIVHHILAFYDPSNVSQQLDDADPAPGFASNGGSFPSDDAVLIGVWVPGMGHTMFPENLAIPLPAGSDFVFEVHYAPGSQGQQANVNMRIDYKEAPFIRPVYHNPLLYHGPPSLQEPFLFIPANTVQTFHEVSVAAPVSLSLISVFPHMHLLGQSFKVYGLTPEEDTIRVVDVDNYDFHWQFSYTFPTLTQLPQGSILYGEATYDNTEANDDNPNNPIADVGLGENTTDEMMVCFFMYTVYFPGDENISLVNVNNPSAVQPTELFVFPNPTKDLLMIDIPNNVHRLTNVSLINLQGQALTAEYTFSNGRMIVDTENLPVGIYHVLVQSDKGAFSARFVKQ